MSNKISLVYGDVSTIEKAMSTQWALTMGDDDQYSGNIDEDGLAIFKCVEYGRFHNEEADYGIMYFRISTTHAVAVNFTVVCL